MQLRVAVIGRSKIIIEDISSHIAHGDYFVCPLVFSTTEIVDKLNRLHPHIIIICLNDESPDEIKEYELLELYTGKTENGLIVIGHPSRNEMFKQETHLRHIFYVQRPLNKEELFQALDANRSKISHTDEVLFQEKIKELKAISEKQQFEAYKKQRAIEKGLEEEKTYPMGPIENPNDKENYNVITTEKGRKTVLVIDTDVMVLSALKDFLSRDYFVVCVPNMALALKFSEKQKPSAIILDYTVSLKGNFEEIPKIVMTATSDKAILQQVLYGLKPTALLKKPIEKDLLLSKLKDVFNNFVK